MIVRYYKGSIIDRDHELSADEALASPAYTRTSSGADDQLEKSEYIANGRLWEVNYYRVADPQMMTESHRRAYPGVPYAIWEFLGSADGYVWQFVSFFSPVGEPTGFRKFLSNQQHRTWMQLDFDASHRVSLITKYLWGDDDKLRYVFEYSADGALVDGFDVTYGEQASFEEVRDDLEDPEFYEHGYRLPRALASTTIPDAPA
jgi:hypothetical protein